MLRPGDVLDLGPLGAVFRIKKTAAETQGTSFDMEWELAPRTGGTPIHNHPHATETYEVLEGRVDLYVNGEWRTLTQGESLAVEKGTPHTFRNASDAPTRVYNTHQPAMRFDAYFAGLASLVDRGIIASEKPGPKAMLHLATHMTAFPDEIRTVHPPHAIIRILGAIGRTLGYGQNAPR